MRGPADGNPFRRPRAAVGGLEGWHAELFHKPAQLGRASDGSACHLQRLSVPCDDRREQSVPRESTRRAWPVPRRRRRRRGPSASGPGGSESRGLRRDRPGSTSPAVPDLAVWTVATRAHSRSRRRYIQRGPVQRARYPNRLAAGRGTAHKERPPSPPTATRSVDLDHLLAVVVAVAVRVVGALDVAGGVHACAHTVGRAARPRGGQVSARFRLLCGAMCSTTRVGVTRTTTRVSAGRTTQGLPSYARDSSSIRSTPPSSVSVTVPRTST